MRNGSGSRSYQFSISVGRNLTMSGLKFQITNQFYLTGSSPSNHENHKSPISPFLVKGVGGIWKCIFNVMFHDGYFTRERWKLPWTVLPLDGGGSRWGWTWGGLPSPSPLPPGEREFLHLENQGMGDYCLIPYFFILYRSTLSLMPRLSAAFV
jgi:hypothetical protein